MRKSMIVSGLVAILALTSASIADPLQVTEIYVGLSGPDGTEDWFEVTNFGDTTVDTGNYKYDDESADPLDAGLLDSILLAPGESAVFLIESTAAEVAEFEAIWGTGATIGTTVQGGGLSQNGDAVVLLDAATDAVVETVTFSDTVAGELATIEVLKDTPALSTLGVNFAYESNEFENDNFGLPNDMVTLIGSPGMVPEPTSMLLVLAGAMLIRKR